MALWTGGRGGRGNDYVQAAGKCVAPFAQVAGTCAHRLHKWNCVNGLVPMGHGLVVGCGPRVGDPCNRVLQCGLFLDYPFEKDCQK